MTRLTQSLLTAAALSVLATGAFAQTRVDRSGATDANTRVGSNGRNASDGGRQNPWDISNRIVYGNVTGGKQFRGNTASTDPQAFRGATGSRNFDDFVRSSSGVTTGGVATYNANNTRAYYGDSRAVAPPVGSIGVSSTGGYTPPVPQQWISKDPRVIARSATDPAAIANSIGSTTAAGGPVDNIYAPNATTGANATLSDYTNLNTSTVAQITPSQIKQLQADDGQQNRVPGQTPQNGNTTSNTTDAQPQQVRPGNAPLNATPEGATPGADGGPGGGTTGGVGVGGGISGGAKTSGGDAVSSTAVTPGTVNNAVTGVGVPETGTVTRMVTRNDQKTMADKAGTAAAETAQGNQPTRPGQAAEKAARDYNAQVRAAKQADGKKTDDQPGPTGTAKAAPNNPAAQRAAASDAVAVKGVSDMLSKAEAQMKEGKFASAIDTYNAAEALAPRAAVVKLGRANAQLGGAYYRAAEGSLRKAYAADKNLLKAHADLRSFLGDERLQTVTKDLNDQVQNKPGETGPAVLLAYVFYNTGNEARAKALLDLAEKRSNGNDALVKEMKAGWTFGSDNTK